MKDKQKVSLTLLDKILITLSFLMIVGISGTLIMVWSKLPDMVPVHFNFLGDADRFGQKVNMIIFLIVMTIVYASVLFSSKLQKSHFFRDSHVKELDIELYKNDRLMRNFMGFETIDSNHE